MKTSKIKQAHLTMIVTALVCAIIISGCSAQNTTQDVAKPSGEQGTSTNNYTEGINKTENYSFITAKLEKDALSITISEEEFREIYGTAIQAPEFGKPHMVAGMKGSYTDMMIGSMGNAINPYVFLLTKEGTVECVPVAEQIVEGRGFSNVGEVSGLASIVSFREGKVTDEYGAGYRTIFAVSSDGKEYDLAEAWFMMNAIP